MKKKSAFALPTEDKTSLLNYLERTENVIRMLRETAEARFREPDKCKITFGELAKIARDMATIVAWVGIQLEWQDEIEKNDLCKAKQVYP